MTRVSLKTAASFARACAPPSRSRGATRAARQGFKPTSSPPLRSPRRGRAPSARRPSLLPPNRHEVQRLSGLSIRDVRSLEAAARALRRLGAEAVLVKGGHMKGPLVDVFYDGRRMVRLGGRRYRKELHGAGCTLAASTAAYLALGFPLLAAVRRARRRVALGFRSSYRAGHGIGIINSQIRLGREDDVRRGGRHCTIVAHYQ